MATKLPGDPGHHGDYGSPVPPDPFQHIIAVHWGGGGPYVVAEVPGRFFYLAALMPADPDQDLVISAGADGVKYEIGQDIPDSDRDISLNILADLTGGETLVENMSTDGPPFLLAGDADVEYHISGVGIPSETTMKYNGGLSGTLSAAATQTLTQSNVAIEMNWLFKPLAPNGVDQDITQLYAELDASELVNRKDVGEGAVGYFVADGYTGGITNRFHTDDFFDTLERPDQYIATWLDTDLNEVDNLLYNGLLLPGNTFGFPPPDFWPGYEMNDVGGPVVASVLQVIRPYSEEAQTYIVNFDRVSDVAVIGKPFQSHEWVIPGYLSGGNGLKLRGYPAGVRFQFDSDWRIEVVDPVTFETVPELWTETIQPGDPPPYDEDTQIAHFGRDGLL